MVGKIRFRQLRVSESFNCGLSSSVSEPGIHRLAQFVDACYPAYSYDARSEATFGPSGLHKNGSGFVYTSAADNGVLSSIEGEVSNYDGSGFVRDLDALNRSAYVAAVEELRSNFWIDRQTRAVVVSINLYNSNYNYYCVSEACNSPLLNECC